MSVNLIDSSDITVSQTNNDIELNVNDSVVEAFTGDLTNLTTTDKSNLVSAINEINAVNGKNIIMVQLTRTQSFGSAYTKLNLSAGTTIGTKLSVSSNQVRIGSGVNHIKLSATFGYNYASAGMRYLRITKNFDTSSIDTTSIALQQKYENSTNHVGTISITDVVVPVSEGDLIGMYVYGLNGDSVRYTTSGMIQTNMTIEVVD